MSQGFYNILFIGLFVLIFGGAAVAALTNKNGDEFDDPDSDRFHGPG
jgi:hypothetical protein